jgi:hypothetical protein
VLLVRILPPPKLNFDYMYSDWRRTISKEKQQNIFKDVAGDRKMLSFNHENFFLQISTAQAPGGIVA